ncbi:hypothetical protein D9756_006331 [Leucocoprinus leucothites]|uniref:Uncharacterized protein n=1 Tax=Leucocoprinus leucothites TaxID=201217 RepID=A0A8H5D2X0_9AGAR|nr:hypothetical protein D9756_006331 [Leucoagaricus leucothites]
MTYWLNAGVLLSSTGVTKLRAYQAWFTLMNRGNNIRDLDLNLGAIKGSINDACFLLLKRRNRLLTFFVLSLLGVNAAIPLIVGLSILQEDGVRYVTFQFNGTSDLPNSSLRQKNNDGQLKAIQKMVPWILDDDESHGQALKGTLVTPDSRSAYASNALPGGPRINGWFECQGWDNYTAAPPGENGWFIWFNETRFSALPSMSLAASMWVTNTARTQYVWVSNTTGLIPNATTTKDGGLDIAMCIHHLEMIPEEPRKAGVDYLTPTAPRISGCDSTDTNICVADSVNNAIVNWWGGTGAEFWDMACRGGVIGPIHPRTDEERYCPITQELWRQTTIAMLDGIIQTAPKSVSSVQALNARVVGLNLSRWWLNAIIPVATVAIYLVGLFYTCWLSQGHKTLKELNLEEVVRAAQTDHVHDLILTGQLKKAPIRYHSDVGFVDNTSRSTTAQMNRST